MSYTRKIIVQAFVKEGMRPSTVNELKKHFAGICNLSEIRTAVRELEDHNVLRRQVNSGPDNRFRLELNPNFNSKSALTNPYWDEILSE